MAIAAAIYALDMLRTKGRSLLDPAGRPLGDDFVNYWAGAFLAWHGRAAEVYNWPAYHAFQQSSSAPGLDPYLYSYPPILLILTAPLAALPYLPGLAAWLIASWFAFYRALRLAMPGRDGAAARARDTGGVRERLWRTERHLDGRAFRRRTLPDRAAPVRRRHAVRA